MKSFVMLAALLGLTVFTTGCNGPAAKKADAEKSAVDANAKAAKTEVDADAKAEKANIKAEEKMEEAEEK